MENNVENNNEDIESILSDLSSINEDNNYVNNYKLINNDYTCDKCNSIPEITNIDFIKNTIRIECPKHKNELSWNDFINSSLKNHYYFSVCNICNKSIQKNNEHIFKYCYDCNKIICEKCFLNHNKDHKVINNNEYYNKCPKHFNQKYSSFCFDCKENICDECKRSKIHKGHKKNDFIEIEPTKEEINYIKDFLNKFESNLDVVKNSGKKEIEELKNNKEKLIVEITNALVNQNRKIKEEIEKQLINNLEFYEKKKMI